MFTLPTLPPAVLKQTHQELQGAFLSLSTQDKVAIGHTGLFLHHLGCLDNTRLHRAIKRSDKKAINNVVGDAIDSFERELTTVSDLSNVSIGIELEYKKVVDDKRLIATVSAECMGYDLQPLEYLSDNDATIIAHAIAEIRNIFIYAPLPEDLDEYGSWRTETIDELHDWLPKHLRNKPLDDLLVYWEEHCESFYDGEYVDDESIVQDYVTKRTKRPLWYKSLGKSLGDKSLTRAINRLKKESTLLKNKKAQAFVGEVIQSITDYKTHFSNNQKWLAFHALPYDTSYEVRNDEPEFDFGFMFTWGGDGYWFDVCSDLANGFMQAGETPSFIRDVTDEDEQELFKLHAERLYRGASLFKKLSVFTNELELDSRFARSGKSG